MKIRAWVLSTLLFVNGAFIMDAAASGDLNSPAVPVKAAKTLRATGSVASVDIIANTITVVGRGRKKPQWIFSVPTGAKITQGKKAIALGDITTGSSLAVKYTKDGDTLNASSIQVLRPKK